MNKTRIQWTNAKCCEDRKSSEVEFFAISSFSIFISIAFYIATFLFALRKERLEFRIPDDLMPPENRDQTNRRIMNIHVDDPSTSATLLSENGAKQLDLLDDSASSDEEISPIENQNLFTI